jgi:hypothetical protein
MAQQYAHIVDGTVLNVIIVESPGDVDLPGTLVPLNKYNNGQWGIGWKIKGNTFVPPSNQSIPAPRLDEGKEFVAQLREMIAKAETFEELKSSLLSKLNG